MQSEIMLQNYKGNKGDDSRWSQVKHIMGLLMWVCAMHAVDHQPVRNQVSVCSPVTLNCEVHPYFIFMRYADIFMT